jgi:hypothetical protein
VTTIVQLRTGLILANFTLLATRWSDNICFVTDLDQVPWQRTEIRSNGMCIFGSVLVRTLTHATKDEMCDGRHGKAREDVRVVEPRQ